MVLPFLLRHLNEFLQLAGHPQSGLKQARRAFIRRMFTALILAGDTLLTALVRQFPNKELAMKHRYKAADRMLRDVDLVPVAAQQTEILGAGVGKWTDAGSPQKRT